MSKSIYCGIGKIPKNSRRGNMMECALKKQVRYYGLNKVDSNTMSEAEASNSKDKPLNKLDAFRNIAKKAGFVSKYKMFLGKKLTPELRAQYTKELVKAEKEYEKAKRIYTMYKEREEREILKQSQVKQKKIKK